MAAPFFPGVFPQFGSSSKGGSLFDANYPPKRVIIARQLTLANLADKAGTIHVTIEAHKEDGFDPVWLRNAVTEPVEESGAEVDG